MLTGYLYWVGWYVQRPSWLTLLLQPSYRIRRVRAHARSPARKMTTKRKCHRKTRDLVWSIELQGICKILAGLSF